MAALGTRNHRGCTEATTEDCHEYRIHSVWPPCARCLGSGSGRFLARVSQRNGARKPRATTGRHRKKRAIKLDLGQLRTRAPCVGNVLCRAGPARFVYSKNEGSELE